jgi:hypothetical protein
VVETEILEFMIYFHPRMPKYRLLHIPHITLPKVIHDELQSVWLRLFSRGRLRVGRLLTHFTLVVMKVFTRWESTTRIAVKSQIVLFVRFYFTWEVMRAFTRDTESLGFSCTRAHSWTVGTTWIVTQCQWIPTYSFWKWKGTQLFGTRRVWSIKTNKKKSAWNSICKSVTEGYESKCAQEKEKNMLSCC